MELKQFMPTGKSLNTEINSYFVILFRYWYLHLLEVNEDLRTFSHRFHGSSRMSGTTFSLEGEYVGCRKRPPLVERDEQITVAPYLIFDVPN